MHQQRKRPLQQSKMTKSSMGKGKKEKEGYSMVKLSNRHLPFQLPYMNPVINWGNTLRYSDSEMRWYQKRHTHLQLHKERAVKWHRISTKTFICQDVYFVPLVGGLLLHLY
jgi:hypothetical protein